MKNILLSILFILILAVSLLLVDLFLYWSLENLIQNLFTWFNNRYWIAKILILIFGGGVLFIAGLAFVEQVVESIGTEISNAFPSNFFTKISTKGLIVINILFLISRLWHSIHHWNFWGIVEFGIVCAMIVLIHKAFLPDSRKTNFQ